ncbi:unnamed protein product [Bursaphelenchus xylophilus]|uniref:(pine wood nematode) hypothetical protein n=1 Tax=Bursaphelenchus xylophilus TaxID=6326 RepID=A0A1I7SM84_BURXY|nr:unnamed protein product [Bursaphelenchus xylophilus]CAG9130040.1 unnamed protein product [Bursaphelenchus xylophilus]
MFSMKLALSIVLVGFVVVSAQKKAGGVSCYQCNSFTAGQEVCESSDEKELTKFKKPCPKITEGELVGTDANSCRKILQTVDGDSGVVRECAYTGDEEVDGKRRIGNKGIVLWLYQCFNDEPGKPCNSASTVSLTTVSIFTAFAFIYNLLQ